MRRPPPGGGNGGPEAGRAARASLSPHGPSAGRGAVAAPGVPGTPRLAQRAAPWVSDASTLNTALSFTLGAAFAAASGLGPRAPGAGRCGEPRAFAPRPADACVSRRRRVTESLRSQGSPRDRRERSARPGDARVAAAPTESTAFSGNLAGFPAPLAPGKEPRPQGDSAGRPGAQHGAAGRVRGPTTRTLPAAHRPRAAQAPDQTPLGRAPASRNIRRAYRTSW